MGIGTGVGIGVDKRPVAAIVASTSGVSNFVLNAYAAGAI